jgi:hypothetical protein
MRWNCPADKRTRTEARETCSLNYTVHRSLPKGAWPLSTSSAPPRLHRQSRSLSLRRHSQRACAHRRSLASEHNNPDAANDTSGLLSTTPKTLLKLAHFCAPALATCSSRSKTQHNYAPLMERDATRHLYITPFTARDAVWIRRRRAILRDRNRDMRESRTMLSAKPRDSL